MQVGVARGLIEDGHGVLLRGGGPAGSAIRQEPPDRAALMEMGIRQQAAGEGGHAVLTICMAPG
ncbi:hypothetical protein GCM10027572_07080 [Flexivirga lutea]